MSPAVASTGSAASSGPSALDRAVEAACARIAPAWPLDRFIAVNPLWGFLDRPVPEVSARLASYAGSRCVMSRRWFREQWEEGRFDESHLRKAIARAGASCTVADLMGALVSADGPTPRRALVTDVMDARRDTVHGMAWCDFVAHGVSQHCAAYFDEGQATLGPDRTGGLYPSWRRAAERDRSPALLMGFRGYREVVRRLPDTPQALIAEALAALAVPPAETEAYLTSLLLRLNGWASWCAYRKWQARLQGGDDDQIVHLLAVRLAWEWILFRGHADPAAGARWQAAIRAWPALDRSSAADQEKDWLLQAALEIAYQEPVVRGLVSRDASRVSTALPTVQAVFCIDVRSEVFRRALEAVDGTVQTLGFAGFFGLPVEYLALGAPDARPQLPGLLAPSLRVGDTCAGDAHAADALAARRRGRLDVARAWKQLRATAVSTFSFVEALGVLSAVDLVGNALGVTRPVPRADGAGLRPDERAALKPRLSSRRDGGPVDRAARADLAAGVLRAMSLTAGHARLVALVGHGSASVNNPHAAGLDCGACCGQTGEVNARALAALLNEPDVRAGLADRGIHVPASTWFVAGLHHTTTDEVALFDLDELPESHRADVASLRAALREAGRRARSARAGALGLGDLAADDLTAAVRARATGWSEVRPEWGLAGNAAFVVAPRERTRHLDLAGRSFLHEYRWREDRGFGVLELILTAPMVVTHWINLQYYASTVDNRRFGSGNKVLHNVVGGHLGVFEGNGGDLRTGLALQSLHDGSRWVHTPLRLSVFVEAPRDAIDGVVAKHAVVRQLVENEWLHLFQVDGDAGRVFARRGGRWVEA